MRLRIVLNVLLFALAPVAAHAGSPEAGSLQSPRLTVLNTGTKSGQPFVRLSFRPFPRDPALEQFSVKEAQAFVEALREALGASKDDYPKQRYSSITTSGTFIPPSSVSPELARRMQRIREEYEGLYGAVQLPSPDPEVIHRFMTALLHSLKYMPEGVLAGGRELLSSETVRLAILASCLTYFVLWLAPEPVFSKAIASAITVGLMAVYGVSEIINVAKAFIHLYEGSRDAKTPDELDAVSRRFGTSMGAVGLRIAVMVAGVRLSKALPNISMPKLGGGTFIQAPPGGAGLHMRSSLQAVAAGPNGVTVPVPITTATAAHVDVSLGTIVLMGTTVGTTTGAVSAAKSSLRTTGDCRPESNKGNAERHHIATNKHGSERAGGPWTKQFQDIFARAGMDLDDPANTILLLGHKGPHPEQYHTAVRDKLVSELGDCATVAECRKRLEAALDDLAADICNPGSVLNKLAKKQ